MRSKTTTHYNIRTRGWDYKITIVGLLLHLYNIYFSKMIIERKRMKEE